MVSASVVWTAVKVVDAITALVIGAVCVVVCYKDGREKEGNDICPHFDTGDCVYVEPKTGMPLVCPCSTNCCNCNMATRKELAKVRTA